MALVSYGSSGESDISDNDEEMELQSITSQASSVQSEPVQSSNQKNDTSPKVVATFEAGHISDEEGEDEWIGRASIEVEDLDIPGLSTSKSIFSALPQASTEGIGEPESEDYVDENEDLSTIPEAKTYESEPLKLNVKKNRKGPIKIMAPSLNLVDSDDESDGPVKRRITSYTGPQKKSNLLSLLPAPKNSVSFVSSSASSSASSSTTTSSTTAVKPSTSLGLIPRSISRPPIPSASTRRPALSAKRQKLVDKNEDSDSDDDASFSYFTLDKEEIPDSVVEEEAFKARLAAVKATPETNGPELGENFQYQQVENQNYGPAVGVYPPPASVASASHRDQDDGGLMADEEALQRLVGKNQLRKKRAGQEISFIEVNNDDIKPDPREWMTNALTDDSEKGEPGPKCMIKGEKKRKHQITYLAALAKEREHVLKQQWSANAQTRRATQSKYDLPLLTFSIESSSRIKTHCSVKEFTAEEGRAYLPKWMMIQLNLNPGDDVTVRMVNLPEGTSATFRINKQEALQYYNPVTVLENHLRRYPCLSLDDNLEIENDGVVVSVTVTTLEPADAVSIVDVDLNIDIEWTEEEEAAVQPSWDQTQPDFAWQLGSLRFHRYETRPDRTMERPDQNRFPGQGLSLTAGQVDKVVDDDKPTREIVSPPTSVTKDGSQTLLGGSILTAGHQGEEESQGPDSGSNSDFDEQSNLSSNSFIGPLSWNGSRSWSFSQEDLSLPIESDQDLVQRSTSEPMTSFDESHDQEYYEFVYSLVQTVEQSPEALSTQVFEESSNPDQDSKSTSISRTSTSQEQNARDSSLGDENAKEGIDDDGESSTDKEASLDDVTNEVIDVDSKSSKDGEASSEVTNEIVDDGKISKEEEASSDDDTN